MVAIFSPIFVILALVIGIMSATADHNTMAIELCFNGGVISGNVPAEFREYIEDMQYSFSLLDYGVSKINNQTENGNSLDSLRVKAVFYALYFGADRPSLVNTLQFSDCFVTYEKRTRRKVLLMFRGFKVDVPDQSRIEQSFSLYPKIIPRLTLALGVGNKSRDQLQNILFAFDIGKRIVVHGLLEIDGIENFDFVALALQQVSALHHDAVE